MGSKTKIDWCDSTWNPVTGCLHGCEYCYARKIAQRFEGWNSLENKESVSGLTIFPKLRYLKRINFAEIAEQK